MAQVFAGFVAGYAMALITTPLLAWGLVHLRARNEMLMRIFPREANMIATAMLLHTGLTMVLTALGIVLGLILLGMKDGDGALGSPNWPFTLFVAAMTLAIVAPVAIIIRPMRRIAVGYALLGLAVFGWLMPYLAEWSKFES